MDKQTRIATSNHSSLSFSSTVPDSTDSNPVRKKSVAPPPPDRKAKTSLSSTNSNSSDCAEKTNNISQNKDTASETVEDLSSIERKDSSEKNIKPPISERPPSNHENDAVKQEIEEISNTTESSKQTENTYL